MHVAILGAGGSMGQRITRTLAKDSSYKLRLVEPAERGRGMLEADGFDVTSQDAGLAGAEVVVFAVPDRLIGTIATEVVPLLDRGTSMLFLDPAAVAVGKVPHRDDVSCFVTHPTHPPLYSILGEADAAARRDYWGGGLATQAIVFATAWGDTDEARKVERLAKDMFAPISASHTVSVDQMTMLEPALSEVLINGCVDVIREGMQRATEKGLPREAVWDFCMGHLQIGIALIFEQLDWQMSDGAKVALGSARKQLFREDWDHILEPDAIARSLHQITDGS